MGVFLEFYHGCFAGLALAQSSGFLLRGHTSHTSAGAFAALLLALPSRRAKTCPAANSSCTGNSLSQTVTSWYLSLAALIFIAHSKSEATWVFQKWLPNLEEREGARLKH